MAAISLLAACGKSRPQPTTPVAKQVRKLAVLSVESDAFPKLADEATASLARAEVAGVERQISQVSVEVVQLSIECLEPTAACYGAVARSLAADALLFAQVAKGPKRRSVKVTVTLFDRAAGVPKTSEKQFANEREAVAGVAQLVTEATR